MDRYNKNTFKGITRPSEEFDFEKILDTLVKNGWIIATLSLTVLIGSIFYFYKKPNQYRALSKLIVVKVSRESLVAKPEVENIKSDRLRGWGQDKSQLIILTGSEMMEELAMSLNLTERFKARTHKEAASIAKGMVRASYVDKSDVIQIEATSSDPTLCRDIANGLADIFAKDYIRQRLYLSKEILKWFPDEAKDLSTETVYGQIKALSDMETISSLPSVVHNPVIKSLKERKNEIARELAKLSEHYKDKYPKVISLKSELDYIDSQISKETDAIVRGIKSQLSGFLQINTVRVIEYADIPVVPIGPNRPRGIFLTTLLSFLVTVGSIVVLNTLNTKIANDFDLREHTNLPFLGYVPRIKTAINSKTFFAITNGARDDELRDAFAYIRTCVSFSAPKEKSKLFLITSSVPAEGKSLLSTQLSAAFSINGEKTLLVDGDLRRPSIHKSLAAKKEPGLTECLTGAATPDGVIKKVNGRENLFFITSGHTSPNPSELLGSMSLKTFLQEVRGKFDRIIIDSAPLLDLPDSFLLSSIADGVILVLRSNRMDRRILARSLEKLRQSKAVITGVVINDFVYQKHSPYYYRSYRSAYYKP